MNKLKAVKNSFNMSEIKIYNKKFKNKQLRFAFSNIALIFNPDLDVEYLINNEKLIMESDKTSLLFHKSFQTLSAFTDKNIEWKEFADLLWFSYQTSTYWKDSKKGIKNIFTKDNYIKLNSEKRNHYYKWIKSIPKDTINYNQKILSVMKVIF